jgi:hypothetical protein
VSPADRVDPAESLGLAHFVFDVDADFVLLGEHDDFPPENPVQGYWLKAKGFGSLPFAIRLWPLAGP